MHYKQYKSILSPDNNMNIYRGCQHGCIYCDSRSLCYHIEHDFCDIEVKTDAPKQLAAELDRKRKKCMISTGAMTDPYIPLETELQYTRQCLQAVYNKGFGIALQTKFNRILRDAELIESINNRTKAVVQMTLTTFDDKLCSIIEPNVCPTSRRFEVLQQFARRSVPTVVWLSHFLPFINDTEQNIRGLLDYCVQANVRGVLFFGVGVTLREGDREYFYSQLDKHFPSIKQKYISTFGNAYECTSPNSMRLSQIVYDTCRKNGIMCGVGEVFKYLRDFPDKQKQISLFD